MSKFEELCLSYNKLINDAAEYERQCKVFAKDLVKAFIEYLEAGRNDVIIRNFSLEEGGFYNCNIEITLYESSEKHADKGLVPEIPLVISRNNGEFHVRIRGTNQVFVIFTEEVKQYDKNNGGEPERLFETIFRGIKSYYETPVDDFIKRNLTGVINFGS